MIKRKDKKFLVDSLKIPMIFNNNFIMFPKSWDYYRRIKFIHRRKQS